MLAAEPDGCVGLQEPRLLELHEPAEQGVLQLGHQGNRPARDFFLHMLRLNLHPVSDLVSIPEIAHH
jgi:hypothetical protein